MQYTKKKPKVYKLEANATGMSMVKNPQNFSLIWRNIQSQIHSIIINQNVITNQTEINKQILSFYQSFFSRKLQIQTDKTKAYLANIPLPKPINDKHSVVKVFYLKMIQIT